MASTISHCMICKNEAHCIATVVKALAPIVLETVVVDTGSTDGSQALLASLGVRVIPGPDVKAVGFSAVRNLGISVSRGDYILAVDPDETITPEDLLKVAQLPSLSPTVEAFSFPRKHWMDLGMTKIWGLPPVESHPRLIKNLPHIRFVGFVHEKLAGFRSHSLIPDITVNHFNYVYCWSQHPKAHQRHTMYLEMSKRR